MMSLIWDRARSQYKSERLPLPNQPGYQADCFKEKVSSLGISEDAVDISAAEILARLANF